jgi:hypothetical protein
VLLGRFPVAFDATSGKRPQVLVLQLAFQSGDLMAELLQRELQAVAPFAETRFRVREHPRNAINIGELDLAGVTAEPALIKGQRRLVTTRTRKIRLQLLHIRHARLYST